MTSPSPLATIGALYPALDDMPPLLLSLDLMVKQDRAPSGMTGLLSIGVRTRLPVTADCGQAPRVIQWWHAHFTPKGIDTELTLEAPLDATSVLVMGEAEATALVERGALPSPAETLELFGDKDLLIRFIQRYCASRSWLQMRMGGDA